MLKNEFLITANALTKNLNFYISVTNSKILVNLININKDLITFFGKSLPSKSF